MGERYSAQRIPDLHGRTFLVTGANTGLGFATTQLLASKSAKVLLACRSETRANAAIEKIRRSTPGANLLFIPLDLGDLASIHHAIKLIAHEPELHGLVNNAGVMMPPWQLTQDGFELQFGVNHLGHFALTMGLLDQLEQTVGARVVNVASAAHRFGRIDFEDLQAERQYRPSQRYAMSKLANLLFTFELQRRLSGARRRTLALACHPGGADTELARYIPQQIYRVLQPLAKHVINTPAEGALPTLRALTDPTADSGDYFGPAGWFEIASSATKVRAGRRALDLADAKKLWRVSQTLTQVNMPLGL